MGTTAHDRAVGALLGLAAGDAVGTTLEFASPGAFTPIDDMVGGGPFGLLPGQWTDDTSLALCLAESLLDRGGHDPADQLRRYVRWWRAGYLSSNGRCFDIGTTTRNALDRFERTGEPFASVPDEDAAANGSLMRLAPVAIRWYADPGEAAAQGAASSRTTHPATRPTDACRVLAAMTAALIAGVPWEAVTAADFRPWGGLHPAVEAVTAGSWRGKEPPAIQGTGYCVDALEAAIWSVAGAPDFRAAVLRAANLGDDADTTAAIAGQLAGARWGAVGIPDAWRAQLVERERIEALATGLFTQGGGVVDTDHWAFDQLLHAYWVEPGRLLAGEYPGHPEETVARRKIDLLADHGIRTIIDLTTVHDGLAPYDPVVASVAAARGIDLVRVPHPIPDLGVVEHAAYDTILATIEDSGSAYVHCWGGIGRTGTVVGCWLVAGGTEPSAVLDEIERLRRGTRKAAQPSPETDAQRRILRAR
ncbi:MAG: ADP-ribosylglycohydrolase family protein [Actinomycetota bacterium]